MRNTGGRQGCVAPLSGAHDQAVTSAGDPAGAAISPGRDTVAPTLPTTVRLSPPIHHHGHGRAGRHGCVAWYRVWPSHQEVDGTGLPGVYRCPLRTAGGDFWLPPVQPAGRDPVPTHAATLDQDAANRCAHRPASHAATEWDSGLYPNQQHASGRPRQGEGGCTTSMPWTERRSSWMQSRYESAIMRSPWLNEAHCSSSSMWQAGSAEQRSIDQPDRVRTEGRDSDSPTVAQTYFRTEKTVDHVL
jgi:hypothetical protein